MPDWDDDKEDAWDALVTRWVGGDPEFDAVSQRNKANRGTEGTHIAGSRNLFRFKEKLVYIYMERPPFIFPSCFYLLRMTFLFAMQDADRGEVSSELQSWKKMKEKKRDLSKPQPQLPEYYNNANENLERYSTTFQSFHPEVDDPLSQEVDERSMVLSGHGRPHGRNLFLQNVVRPSMSFTQAKATLPDGSPLIAPRRRPRRPTSTDVSFSHFHPLSDIRSCMAKLTVPYHIFEIVARS